MREREREREREIREVIMWYENVHSLTPDLWGESEVGVLDPQITFHLCPQNPYNVPSFPPMHVRYNSYSACVCVYMRNPITYIG